MRPHGIWLATFKKINLLIIMSDWEWGLNFPEGSLSTYHLERSESLKESWSSYHLVRSERVKEFFVHFKHFFENSFFHSEALAKFSWSSNTNHKTIKFRTFFRNSWDFFLANCQNYRPFSCDFRFEIFVKEDIWKKNTKEWQRQTNQRGLRKKVFELFGKTRLKERPQILQL